MTAASLAAANAAGVGLGSSLGAGLGAGAAATQQTGFVSELEINDFPQHSRWKVTHRQTLAGVTELTGAAITVRGTYVEPGKAPPDGDRKLFLLIEGPSEQAVRQAKAEIKRVVEECAEKALRRDVPTAGGRYSVM
eukprot:CAMPEP_0175072668 /NCGR_PEP_ID=MMETSP0052_2-20121109/20051_1 /TAXON_ID=51329 ORGANISM="Polytomella parva, Strain SAG 63-3" /NCGR_SAMPLE_ID=MMETSP0052_2 /ASSEMBLY_ACC=CAM_ASM_000194 /LENGTH=135 /DNA_ID=CAMNT_0016340225 /DNA_START=1 /DNA_END=408 /DNA_ORIENTATION=-